MCASKGVSTPGLVQTCTRLTIVRGNGMNAKGKGSPKASPILNTTSNLNGKEGSKDQRLQGGWRRQEVRHQQQCVNRLTLLQLCPATPPKSQHSNNAHTCHAKVEHDGPKREGPPRHGQEAEVKVREEAVALASNQNGLRVASRVGRRLVVLGRIHSLHNAIHRPATHG